MAQHAPAPWTVNRFGHIKAADGWIVMVHSAAPYPQSVKDANARLIAAAPELLEALKALLAEAEEYDFDPGPPAKYARAAIAKAEGSN